jgi:hypothetical protein
MKKICWSAVFYYIKFMIYGGIAVYDYSINSKWVLPWLLLAIMVLIFGAIEDIVYRLKTNNET